MLLALATNKRTWRHITFYKQTEPLPCSLFQCMSLGRAVPLCGAARLWNVTSLCRKSPERALPAELAGIPNSPGADTSPPKLFVETSWVLTAPGQGSSL